MNNEQNTENSQSSFIEEVTYKYLPYWPLFLFFIIIFIAGAWAYIAYTNPVYGVTATILINDEKKGVDENKIEESLNLLTSNKVVDNEVEVLHSRKIMNDVVTNLRLYAPVFVDDAFGPPASAYTSSPISIEVDNPENIKEIDSIYFKYDSTKKSVIINSKMYPLNQFVATPYGNIKFTNNPRYYYPATAPLYFSLVPPRKVTNSLLNNTTVFATTKNSSVINLYMTDEVPERGEDVLNALMNSYKNANIQYKNNLAKNTIAFVDERLRVVSGALTSVEKQIQNYKANQGVTDLGEQGKLYLQNVSNTDQKLAQVNLQLEVLNQVEKYVNSKNNSSGIVPSTLGIDDPVLNKLLDNLYQLETDYERLKKTTGENNPMVQSIATQIERIRPSILENIRNQRTNLEAGKNNLTASNNTYNSTLQALPQKERELVNVSREQSVKNNVYSFLLQKREETALAYASNVDNSRIIASAQAAGEPVSPKKSIIYIIAVMVGFIVSMGVVLAKEMFTGKILFRSQIEDYTSIPIVGEISYFKEKKGMFLKGQNNRVFQEQFRQLRAAAGLFSKTNTKKKILVTSSIPGEGKSLISANLALSLSRSGKKVVLLDMDIRNPQFSKIFNLQNSAGIAGFLEEDINPHEIVEATEFQNLYVLPSGITKANPTELLLGGKLTELFNYLEEEFDYIVVDSSPVSLITDAYILSDFCDLTLYVVRHKYTEKAFIKTLDETNRFKPLKNLAIVFNGIKPRGFIKGTFGYGYGYGYENKYNEKYLIS
ncbi:GumC family protein [Segetibacter koreensis]|uniref:GumC family protein n=1 Tax=Segetibacter koreensis TaxID=398037 RepID=UPI0003A428D1|nr:tyrosine-protein kinase family protein [Segetibacter koreensis]